MSSQKKSMDSNVNKRQRTSSTMTDNKEFNPCVANFINYVNPQWPVTEEMKADIETIKAKFGQFSQELLKEFIPVEAGAAAHGYEFNGHGGHYVREMTDAMNAFIAMYRAHHK